MTDIKLLVLNSNTWNYLTISKQTSSGSFKNVIYELFTTHIYLRYIYIYMCVCVCVCVRVCVSINRIL